MAVTVDLSQKELERVAALAYEGETIKIMLCDSGTSGYTPQNTVTEWQSLELSGSGYARYSEVIGAGAYNATSGRYELPQIDAAFTASGGVLDYDKVVLYIDGATYPYSVLTEAPNVVIIDGQTQTYRLNLNTND